MSPLILTMAILTTQVGGGAGGGTGGGAEVIDAGSAIGGGVGGGTGGGNDPNDAGSPIGGGVGGGAGGGNDATDAGSMTGGGGGGASGGGTGGGFSGGTGGASGGGTGGGTGGGFSGGTGGGTGGAFGGGTGGAFGGGTGGGVMGTGGGGGVMSTGGGGGVMGTGGGGGVIGTGGGGGGTLPSVPNDVWASLAEVGDTNAAVAVWVDDKRDRSFGDARRRGGDLWVNAWTADGGVSAPFGTLLCPISAREILSEPRVAVSAAGATVITWRVTSEGMPGHFIRVATWTSTAGLSSCDDVMVGDGSEPIDSPQLQESNGEFLLIWETPSAVMGQFVTSPAQPAFVISSKVGVAGERASPSLAATAEGFFAAWTQEGGFWGAAIPNMSSGQGVRSAQHYFPNFPPLTSATAAAPPLAGAFISSLNGQPPRVFAVRLDNSTITTPLVGPEAGAYPLVAASLRETLAMRLFVAHQTADATRFLLTEFSTQTHSVPLATGLEPLSMVADERRALLLMGNATTLSVQPILPGVVGTAPSLGTGVATRSEPNQLRHSAVWTDGGAWLVGWNENTTSFGSLLSPQTGGLASAGPPVQDGGIRLLSQVAAGDGVAVSVITRADTRLFREDVSSPGNGTLLLTAPGERHFALVGEQIAALWSLGEEVAVIGRGTPQPQGFPGARLGRCGAWADGSLWIPLLEADGDLAVLEIVDSANTTPPTVHNLGPLPRSGLPCLVARGNDLLLLSHDGDSGILVARTNVDDVRAGKPPIIIPLPAQPGARPVLDPVAAPNARGWQVAWESPDELGSVILGMKLDLLGNPTDGNALALGVDERAPVLVPSAGGAVALVYQHFSDRTGNVVIKTRVLAAEPLPQSDGGVSDGGLSDGGLSDGGLSDGGLADGGFDVLGPVTYDTCGCQSGGASAVLGLLLLVIFGRRRASTRS